MKTIRFACGCIGQRKEFGSLNWIYCGSHDCPYDELGTFRKHVPVKSTLKV